MTDHYDPRPPAIRDAYEALLEVVEAEPTGWSVTSLILRTDTTLPQGEDTVFGGDSLPRFVMRYVSCDGTLAISGRAPESVAARLPVQDATRQGPPG